MYAGLALNTASGHVNACAVVQRREVCSELLNHAAASFLKERCGPSNTVASAPML